jgi:hypothetical protein
MGSGLITKGDQKQKPNLFQDWANLLISFGRDDWIRTSALCVPNAALYQAEPRPDRIDEPFNKNSHGCLHISKGGPAASHWIHEPVRVAGTASWHGRSKGILIYGGG